MHVRTGKKRRAIDEFMSEIKESQERRAADPNGRDDDRGGGGGGGGGGHRDSHGLDLDGGEPMSTNLYLANLAPTVTEELLHALRHILYSARAPTASIYFDGHFSRAPSCCPPMITRPPTNDHALPVVAHQLLRASSYCCPPMMCSDFDRNTTQKHCTNSFARQLCYMSFRRHTLPRLPANLNCAPCLPSECYSQKSMCRGVRQCLAVRGAGGVAVGV